MMPTIPSVRSLASTVEPTDRSRRVGGVHILLAGCINVVSGVVLAYLGTTNGLHRFLLSMLERYMAEYALARRGPDIAFVATEVAILVGACLVLAGLAQLVVGWRSVRSDAGPFDGYRRFAGATGGVVNPLAMPVTLVGLTLCLAASFGGETDSA